MKLQERCPQVDRNVIIKALVEHNGIAAEALAAIRALGEAGQNEPCHEPEVVATHKHFHSQVEETYTCERCGHVQVVPNDHRGFSLPFPTNGQSKDVQDMLASYFQDEEHSLQCVRCGTVCRHTLDKKLSSWPPVLILHIKREEESGRFSNPFGCRYPNKNVDIPSRLDAEVCPSAVYKLRSVVARYGSSAEFGHYTCHVRSEEGTWTEYDDGHVSSYGREPARSLGHNAHIILYTLDPHAPPLAQECEEVRDTAPAPVSKAPQKCAANSALSTYTRPHSMFHYVPFKLQSPHSAAAQSQEYTHDQVWEDQWQECASEQDCEAQWQEYAHERECEVRWQECALDQDTVARSQECDQEWGDTWWFGGWC